MASNTPSVTSISLAMTGSISSKPAHAMSCQQVCFLPSIATSKIFYLMGAPNMALTSPSHMVTRIGPPAWNYVVPSAVFVSSLPAAPLLTKPNSNPLLLCLPLRQNLWQHAMLVGCAYLFAVSSGISISHKRWLRWLTRTMIVVLRWATPRNLLHARVTLTLSILRCVTGWSATSSSLNELTLPSTQRTTSQKSSLALSFIDTLIFIWVMSPKIFVGISTSHHNLWRPLQRHE
jgi:hypothetical protein